MTCTIGIDFGTACVTLSRWEEGGGGGGPGRCVTLARMPAVARMLHQGGALCGEAAWLGRSAYARSTVAQIKRLLGRRRSEVEDSFAEGGWTLAPQSGNEEALLVDAWTGLHPPEAIAAEILKSARLRAEELGGGRIGPAVLTVPATATNAQRLALKRAAEAAGLEVRRILHEPTAIAAACAVSHPPSGGRPARWLIVNFGAGMTDLALVQVGPGQVAVLAAAGDTTLGLAALRQRLKVLLARGFERKQGVPLSLERPEIRSELDWIAEECLWDLSRTGLARTDLKGAGRTSQGIPLDLEAQLDLKDLASLVRPAARRLRELIREVLGRAALPAAGLDRLFFTGGGAQLASLRKTVTETLNREIDPLPEGLSPALAASAGAALWGAALDRRIAFQLEDVLAQGLGLTTVHDGFSTVLPAGRALPAGASRTYTTVADFQERIRFEVREGERPRASLNPLLGAFTLGGIRRAPAGVPSIEVRFEINESGILEVEARDAQTGALQRVQVERAAARR